jgi:adenosylhomocysteinase
VNLGAAEGHPAAVMDMSFAGQALTLHWLTEQHKAGKRLDPAVYSVPADLDAQIASVKLNTMGVAIDTLTPEQKSYLESWQEGT